MIEILKFEMINKGALVAKFNARFLKWGGLIVHECCYFATNGRKWINLPSRQYEVDGKKKYVEYLRYEDRDLNDKFKESILKAVEEVMDKIPETTNQQNDFQDIPF